MKNFVGWILWELLKDYKHEVALWDTLFEEITLVVLKKMECEKYETTEKKNIQEAPSSGPVRSTKARVLSLRIENGFKY